MKMKTNKPAHRVIAVFLTLNFLMTLLPINLLYASNNGPNAPEAASFEPVDATDMVNLATGDFSYVLPLLDLDGFPVTMSYHAGIPLDMESSWVGLGWNLNTGAINRAVSGTPDDWKDGNSLDFIFYEDSQESYAINVGVGFSEAAGVGVGLSWGSNKSLSGSVYANFGIASANIGTDGNYSVGVGLGKDGSNYGGSMSISGNVNESGVSFGVGVRAKSSSGAFTTMGYNFGSNSFSIGAGFSNNQATDKGQAGASGNLSMSNFSAGDFDISSKGFYIPISLKLFHFGFGYRKVTYKLDKAYPRTGFGILYTSDAIENTPDNPDDTFEDLQHRYYYGDAYEEAIPVFQDEFVADYKGNREKVNFSYASYDSYEVNAPGISGMVQPKYFQNATLMGMGYYGTDPSNSEYKMSVYYHNANGNTTSKTFGTSTLGNSEDIKFYFNGQFTEDFGIRNKLLSFVNNNFNNFGNLLGSQNDENSSYKNKIEERQRSGNYVEVFTNQQLYENESSNILYPETFSRYTYGNFDPNGIGAYKITAPDGKTYHYSLPVYHYERIERTILKDNSENHVSEKRQFTPFATHWLLTAVTGPDFIDKNGNNKPDMDDYGYWVRLDHGQWTDGFVWRSPYQGNNFNTNTVGDIGEKDFGNYQLGRKQIYYLDKIVTRTKTAYFVKDVRYDATGAYGGNNGKDLETTSAYNFKFNGPPVKNVVDGGNVPVAEDINYPRAYQLRLDHIVVVNSGSDNFNKVRVGNSNLSEGGCLPGYSKLAVADPYNGGSFTPQFGAANYQVSNEDNIYDVLDFETFDYQKAVRVIQLQHNYDLAQESPSSVYCTNNIRSGRLTLNSIQFRGKNNTEYMPPYTFSYKNEMDYPNLPPRHKVEDQLVVDYAKDPWGFIDEKYVANLNNSSNHKLYGPDNWSLTQIKTPLGSAINIEHEEDDYYIEAFSRKFWQDNLQIAVTTDGNNIPNSYMYFHIKNMDDLREDLITNFNNYFSIGEKAFFDLWLVRTYDNGLFSEDDLGGVDLPSKYDYEVTVDQVSDDFLVLKVYRDPFNPLIVCPPPDPFGTQCDEQAVVKKSWDGISPINYFAKKDGVGSNIYEVKPRGVYLYSVGDGANRHVMSYKLLANKVDRDLTGGGLRVKNIVLEDDMGNEYKTAYYYNKPGTNNDPEHDNYMSSGITSFAPERGLKFVPYQPELPSPGVMYEHVTMEPFNVNGNSIGKTQYEFFTLQPLFDIFNPELEMKDRDDMPIFNSQVFDKGFGEEWISNIKAYAKIIDLKINTSHIGQFKSVSQYNRFEQLISKTTNNYVSGEDAKLIDGRGSVRESFQTMKSVYLKIEIPFQNDQTIVKKRLISISSKEELSSVLKSVHTVSNGFETIEEYFDADPNTGAFKTTETKRSDGTQMRTTKLPAYTKYPAMGSKVDNPTNKNMLTQQVMSVTEIENGNNSWEKIAANITTWNPETYEVSTFVGEFPNEVELTQYFDVWRKHKTFTWDGETSTEGYFTNYTGEDDGFDWSDPEIVQPSQWKQLSEVTQYDQFSNPLEIKDINGNLASTKMGYKNSKTIAVSNASYDAAFYSGAEDHDGQGNFGGGVDKGTATIVDDAHTGDHALSVSNGQTGYKVTVNHGESPKPYKISVWAKNGNHTDVRVNVGGNIIAHNPLEEVQAGNWVLLNFYKEVTSGAQVNVTTNGGNVIVDDFRIHPIEASMTSYVYNQWDELTDILGPNNLATKYEYDEAGRLLRIYSEIENIDQILAGGFKKVREYAYTYKGELAPPEEENDPLSLTLGIDDPSSEQAKVIASANGGSGQYEYKWSVKYCNDGDAGCPGALEPNYDPNWSVLDSRNINTNCTKRAVYWCIVKDLVTQLTAQAQGNHKRTGCGGGGGGDDENQL
ncbi:hypothetical protein [Flagellimonas maritima]|nr:hypothetical protein [Allomuricauda aurantiaca]